MAETYLYIVRRANAALKSDISLNVEKDTAKVLELQAQILARKGKLKLAEKSRDEANEAKQVLDLLPNIKK